MENKKDIEPILIKKKDNIYIVVQDFSFEKKNEKIINLIKQIKNEKENENKNLNYIFEVNDLSKPLETREFEKIQSLIIETLKKEGEKEVSEEITDEKINIFIKNCYITSIEDSFYPSEKKLYLNQLYISDELYNMTPKLSYLFLGLLPKILIIKKIKINSNDQLDDFFNFIKSKEECCQELILEDIFIELILKKDNDEEYNELSQYITFENGDFYLVGKNDSKKLKIKRIKMRDCPLFAISDDTFKNINDNKDISIDIDENSLLNPEIITKFKVNEGYTDICFDLDSYKLNENENKKEDYIKYIEYILNIIIDNKDNIKFRKIKFKNFDITKYEYITEEILTYIDEKNWILNKEEQEKKKKFEEYDEIINKKINDNLDKLSELKELIFDNCTNHFIQLILKFIANNNKSEYHLNYLKLKKCGKEYFDLKNILSLNIKKLILFDTPLIVDRFPESGKSHLECFKGTLGKFDNFTISINTLEHYCMENNLSYYKTIEIITELINNKNFNNNLCFEMDALPLIMTFLVAKQLNKNGKIIGKDTIPNDFNFKSIEERQNLIEGSNSPFILDGLENKEITIKKNNIRNRLENYYVIASYLKNQKGSEINLKKSEFGSEIFEYDLDYKAFFNTNKVNKIRIIDNIFSNFIGINDEKYREALYNLIQNEKEENNKKQYMLDMKSLNKVIYIKNEYDNFSNLFKNFINVLDLKDIEEKILKDKIRDLFWFINHLKKLLNFLKQYSEKLTIIFDNIKEKKEFFCLLVFIREVSREENYFDKSFSCKNKNETKNLKFRIPDKKKEAKNKLNNYFLKEQNEEGRAKYSLFNYYYTSEDEEKVFDESNKKINFDEIKLNFEYSYNINEKGNNEDSENRLLRDMIVDNF